MEELIDLSLWKPPPTCYDTYPWEQVGVFLKALQEEAHWKVALEAPRLASDTMRTLLHKHVEDRVKEFGAYPYFMYVDCSVELLEWREDELVKLKAEAQTLLCEEQVEREVALSLSARIESAVAEAIIIRFAEREAQRIARLCDGMVWTRGLWRGGAGFTGEVVRRMNAEEECLQALETVFMQLELTEEARVKVEIEAQMSARELNLLKTEEARVKSEMEAQMYVVVLAVEFLSFVYHYLAGYIDRGGTKTYSPGSLEFGPTYVSIVLFQGAYVWIKFRDAASNKGAYRRKVKNNPSGTIRLANKWEARYKPPRESGTIKQYIYLGMCNAAEEAGIKWKIAAYYYDSEKNPGQLDLGDGDYFLIPPMPTEQVFSVSEMRVWVSHKVKEVYRDFMTAKDARSQQSMANEAILVHSDEGHSVEPIPTAEQSAPTSGGRSLVFDLGFGTEKMQTCLSPESRGDAEFSGFSVDELPDISDMLDSMPDISSQQTFQDVNGQAQDSTIAAEVFDDHTPIDTELVIIHPTWDSEGILNDVVQENTVVAATSNEVDECALRVHEGTPQKSQAGGFPIMSSILTSQQGLDAMAVLLDMVTPSVTDFCPTNSTMDTNSTTGLLVMVAQQLQEQGRMMQEQGRKMQEQGKLILNVLQQQLREQDLNLFMEQIISSEARPQ